ncbi:DUF3570 domain-containing protein [Undibacterium sp. SXout7W]|uniref:DUF3570 domain-containing protein n=1 Tax=Undibacterium sp. SXout7W TaxID=3413049 RepID=UPI003BF24344
MMDTYQQESQTSTVSTITATLLSAAMCLPLVTAVQNAQADTPPERGLVSLKYLDYQDSQPGDDRIKVQATSLKVLAPVYGDWSIGSSYTSDSISGASPAYHNGGISKMHDLRRAFDADVTRYFEHGSLTLGGNVSSESDYLSRGISLQASRSSDSKNTTWTAGIGYNNDTINPNNKVVTNEKKYITDVLFSVTQILTVNDIAQLNLGFTRGRGYYSDPYKIFDHRPRERNSNTVLARWNHHSETTRGTTRLSYRYYSDSWSIKAHTLNLEYVQPVAQGWSIAPSLRLYTQSAASFYVDADPSLYPFPPNPSLDALNYSEDQRVSAFGARTFGLKISKQIDEDWSADIKLEQYQQRSSWRLFGSGSPGLLPFNARMIQVGLARQF